MMTIAWRRLLTVILALCCWRPLTAHSFPGVTADMLFVGDTLTLTIDLHVLDAIAILDGESISGQQSLTHAQLIAGMPMIRDHLTRHIRLTIDGRQIPGQCLGYVNDLAAPPHPDMPLADTVPVRLSFLMVWAVPKESRKVEVAFTLLPKQLAGGFLLATLHRALKVHSQIVEIGRTAIFTVTPESEIADELAGTPGYGAAPGSPAPAMAEPVVTSGELGAGHLLLMGFMHIIPAGLDHILFVVCLFLLSPKPKPLLIQVTAFTFAHSLTLGLAMAGVVLLPSRLVETLIVFSIVVMAVENLFMREVRPWRWVLVFLFGLVHGLGFAGSFSALHLSPGDFARPLLLLNVGIEIAQLTVVGACAVLTCWMWQRPWYTRRVIVPTSATIALLATWWTIQRGFGIGG
jgi:hypothetical protein